MISNRNLLGKLNTWRMCHRLCTSSSTADRLEVNKFDRCSEEPAQNWYASSIMKPLRAMNLLRVPLIRDHLLELRSSEVSAHQPLSGLRLLDVGCGGGLLSQPLARLGANVLGLDANSNAVTSAVMHRDRFEPLLKDRLHFQCGTLEQMTDSSSFDALIASEVLEHVSDVTLFIQSANRLLRPRGKLIVTTINQTVFALFGAIWMAENVLSLAPKGTHTYDRLVLLNALEMLLNENGFRVDLVHGMCFNPITQQWSWTTNTSINYALVATKLDR